MKALRPMWIALALGLLAPAAAGSAPPAPFDASIDAAKKAMLVSPAEALARAREARGAAGAMPDAAIADATARWLEGEALTRLGRAKEALASLAAAIDEVERTGPGGKLHGDLLRARGNAHAVAGEVQPALGDFQRAHDIYRSAGDARGQAMALQNIGAIYTDAGDYPRVLSYYRQSAEVFDGDPALLLSAHNNLGRAFRDLGRLAEAEQQFRRALALARSLGSRPLEASILENLAAAQVDAGRLQGAEASLAQARRIVGGDPDATRFIWGVSAQIAERRGDMARGAELLERTFAGSAVDGEPAFREFHKTAYTIYRALGRHAEALTHLETFKRLDDQARALAASTNAALMAARFDFQNQDLKIASLKAGQAQKEAELAASQARFRTMMFGGALAVAGIVLAVALVALFQIRRSRNQTRAANADLSCANLALEKALRAKTEFLATTSHEIRTPLNGILGMTQVMIADRSIDARTLEKVRLVHGAGETMRALVDDILDVAKMETGNLTLQAEPMRLHRMLSEAADLWRPEAEAKGLVVTLDMGAAPDGIVADEARLRQVVFNLMSNAVKFTEGGSIALAATVSGADGAERLEIIVADTGIGIPAHALTDIFESFRQVDGGTTRRFGGTGLGLAICRNIAVAMGGDIAVESVPGRGSTFRVSVPLTRADLSPTGDDAPDAAVGLLLIEANPLTRSKLTALLGGCYVRIDTAGSLAEARAALENHRYAALLADFATVSGAAPDARVAIREMVEMAGASPLLMLTPPDSDAETASLKEAGVAEVLTRPVAGPAILAALRRLATPAPEREAA